MVKVRYFLIIHTSIHYASLFLHFLIKNLSRVLNFFSFPFRIPNLFQILPFQILGIGRFVFDYWNCVASDNNAQLILSTVFVISDILLRTVKPLLGLKLNCCLKTFRVVFVAHYSILSARAECSKNYRVQK